MCGFEKYTIIASLLSKAVAGKLTADEEKVLEEWRAANGENDRLYQKFMSPDFILLKSETFSKTDVVAAYMKMRDKQRRRARRRLGYRIAAVAASVCLLLGGGVYYFMQSQLPVAQVIPADMETILPGNTKAELILAGGERVTLGAIQTDSVLVEGGAELYAGEGQLSYIGRQAVKEVQYNTLKVPRGGEYSVVLQDGTVVRLNSASVLRYPVQFTEAQRKVFLSGEAYFQVAKDKDHPFVVETGGTATEVLGTSFNICSYAEEDRTETTLVEGTVRFSAAGQAVVLNPGEQGVVDKGGRPEKKKVDIYPYVAWKDGKFVFRKRTLEQVMRVIARWYNVDVVFQNNALKDISFTGNLKRYDNFRNVTDMLSMTGGLEFRVEGRTIYIAGK